MPSIWWWSCPRIIVVHRFVISMRKDEFDSYDWNMMRGVIAPTLRSTLLGLPSSHMTYAVMIPSNHQMNTNSYMKCSVWCHVMSCHQIMMRWASSESRGRGECIRMHVDDDRIDDDDDSSPLVRHKRKGRFDDRYSIFRYIIVNSCRYQCSITRAISQRSSGTSTWLQCGHEWSIQMSMMMM